MPPPLPPPLPPQAGAMPVVNTRSRPRANNGVDPKIWIGVAILIPVILIFSCCGGLLVLSSLGGGEGIEKGEVADSGEVANSGNDDVGSRDSSGDTQKEDVSNRYQRPLESITDGTPYADGWNRLLPIAKEHVVKMENLEPGSEIWQAVKAAHQELIRTTSLRMASATGDETERCSGMMDVLIVGFTEAEMQHYKPNRLRATMTSLKRHGELESWLSLNPGYREQARQWNLSNE